MQVSREAEIAELHRRCGVYTKPDIVGTILDAVGWKGALNPYLVRLLEPAAGDGIFVAEAGTRLVQACRTHGVRPTASLLGDSIRSFEIKASEARRARANVQRALELIEVNKKTAAALAKRWVVTGDFLLADPDRPFTHAVGNPPYVRWSRIPIGLRKAYEKHLPSDTTGGDLFLPFLDRALDQLEPRGRLGMICSDRWRFMAFATTFREKWLPKLIIQSEDTVLSKDAFQREVDAYPSILIARKASERSAMAAPAIVSKRTIIDAGYEIRVGPALGHAAAYVLPHGHSGADEDVVAPWVDGSEIADGSISWSGRNVLTMYDREGKLRDLDEYPRMKALLLPFKKVLEARSIVKAGAKWYQPIDKVSRTPWLRPKLLVPELAKTPRVALDTTGAIPSHGVYAVFSKNDDLQELVEAWANGGLAKALLPISPTVKGGYVRCYKRFLAQIPAP